MNIMQLHGDTNTLAWGHKHIALEKLQKKAVRVIACSKYNAHTNPIFKSLKILKLSDLYVLGLLKFYFKHSNDQLPTYLQSISFIKNNEVHGYRTRSANNLRTAQIKHTFAKQCLCYVIPTTINQLPNCVTDKVQTHSLWGISLYFKNYCFEGYEIDCHIVNCYICNRN